MRTEVQPRLPLGKRAEHAGSAKNASTCTEMRALLGGGRRRLRKHDGERLRRRARVAHVLHDVAVAGSQQRVAERDLASQKRPDIPPLV